MSNALCVPKSAIFPKGVDPKVLDYYVTDHSLLLDAPMSLHDRANCETDETLLQVIPYITIYDTTSKDIFIYSRGKASAERRLSGKCSIGLGGHMEVDPTGKDILSVIASEAARELEEEIGLPADDSLNCLIHNTLLTGKYGIMYNNRTEVDRVHIAVAFFIPVDSHYIMSLRHEVDVVTKSRWMSIKEIYEANLKGEFEIEHWTRMVLEAAQIAWAD